MSYRGIITSIPAIRDKKFCEFGAFLRAMPIEKQSTNTAVTTLLEVAEWHRR